MIRNFGLIDVMYLVAAARWTLALTATAFAGSAVLGLILAIARILPFAPLRWLAAAYIHIVQGTPLLVWLFLIFFGLPLIGISVNPWLAAAVAFSIYGSAFLGEIWRGALVSIAKTQWEAGASLGLSLWRAAALRHRAAVDPGRDPADRRLPRPADQEHLAGRDDRPRRADARGPAHGSRHLQALRGLHHRRLHLFPDVLPADPMEPLARAEARCRSLKSTGSARATAPCQVLKDVSLDVAKGEIIAMIGRSGSGKSTLLRCINGLEPIQAGSISVDGVKVNDPKTNLRKLRQQVGIVFQSFNLFPHLSVCDNITLAPRVVKKQAPDAAREVARDVLRRVGLEEKLDAFPSQLSGGQQQRVAIARSLAMQPKLMLFDEVTSALDPELTGEVLKVLEYVAQDGMTMILVTHEMGFARRFGSRVVFMHEGRIHEEGQAAAVLAEPKTPELQTFLSAVLH